MSNGHHVMPKLSAALNRAIHNVRVKCGAICKINWINRKAVRKGDYVVTPNDEIARVETVTVEKMPPHPSPTPGLKSRHRRILTLVSVWPISGTTLVHTRPGDKALKAAFRIHGGGLGSYDDDEVDAPGGMGDSDYNGEDCWGPNVNGIGQMLTGPIDAARFPLQPGDLPDTTFVTTQGLKRQDVRFD